MPYDYEALISLFNSGAYGSQRSSVNELVNAYNTNQLEPGSQISELASRAEQHLSVIAKLSDDLQKMKEAKAFASEFEAKNDLLEEAIKDEEAAMEEVRKAEAERKELDDRLEDVKKEYSDLNKRRAQLKSEAEVDQIDVRIDELDQEKETDIPYLQGIADEKIKQKQAIRQAVSSRKDLASADAASARNEFRARVKVDLTSSGIAANDYPKQLELAERHLNDYVEAAQNSFLLLTEHMATLLQTMPHTDPNYNRLAGTVEYFMGVSTAVNGFLTYHEKEQESRRVIDSLKELHRIRNSDELNGNNPDGPQNENRPPVEGEFCAQTKEKLREIRDYQVAPENAAAECARLDEEEKQLEKDLDVFYRLPLFEKHPYLKSGPIEKITELLYVPSRERGTGLFETEEEYRQRFTDERTDAAAIMLTDSEGITTPGFKDFIKDMMKLDMEEPGKGQREFEKQYREKGFSVIHQNVNGVSREIPVDPRRMADLIKRREPSKTELDEDVKNSVEKDKAELKLFNDNKKIIEDYLDLHTTRLKKAAIVEKYPDAAKPVLYQNAEQRQVTHGYVKDSLILIRAKLERNLAQSTFWDTRDYKNFYNALNDAIEGTGDLTNLKNMADTYIAAKGANPRSTYGKARLSCAKLVKGYLENVTQFTAESENLSKKGEQGLDDLGKMPFDRFLSLRQAREEMDILLSDPRTPLTDRQKDKAVKNVMLLLNDKMKKQPSNDAPTEEQIKKSLFPEGKNITKDLLKQALQQTPEQIKEACKEVVSNENGLDKMRNGACYILRHAKTPEETRDGIAKLLVTAIAENNPGRTHTFKELNDRSIQLQREPDFLNFCTDEKLQGLRQEVLRHTDYRAAAALLLRDFSRSVRPVQPQTERIDQPEQAAPLDTYALTKQNAARAQEIRNQRRLAQGVYSDEGTQAVRNQRRNAQGALGGDLAGQQLSIVKAVEKADGSVAFFDRLTNYRQKSQIPENRLEDGQFQGYIAIGDSYIDGRNSQMGIGRPNFVFGFLKNVCPDRPEEWYRDACYTTMDLYYNHLTGDRNTDLTAFYSDFRDTFLLKNGRMPGELMLDNGTIHHGGMSILQDMLRGIEQYDTKVKQTCEVLGRPTPKTRGELEDLQKTLIEKKFENLAQSRTIRPECGQTIKNMLNDPECTLDQRNFLISVDVPTLQKLSTENATVESFRAALNQAEVKFYNKLNFEMAQNQANSSLAFLQKYKEIQESDYAKSLSDAAIPYNLRPSAAAGRVSSLRPSVMSGRTSVRQSVVPGTGAGSRQSVMPTIHEEKPPEGEKKSGSPQLMH